MKSAFDNALAAQAEALARSGRTADAMSGLTGALARGNASAALILANWRMTGDYIRRDLAAARQLFGRASALGLAEAEPIHIALLASGAGGGERCWGPARDRLRRL